MVDQYQASYAESQSQKPSSGDEANPEIAKTTHMAEKCLEDHHDEMLDDLGSERRASISSALLPSPETEVLFSLQLLSHLPPAPCHSPIKSP